MEQGPVIYREEVTAILEGLGDLNVRLREIHELLKEEFGGEEEAEEGWRGEWGSGAGAV